jgi:hypothetical protein
VTVLPALIRTSSGLTITSALPLPNKALSPGSGNIPELTSSLYTLKLSFKLIPNLYLSPADKIDSD